VNVIRRAFPAATIALFIVAVASLSTQPAGATAGDHYLRFPWTFDKTAYITQAYNGSSHQNGDYYAPDLDVEGAGVLGDIRAATAGIVVGRVASKVCDVVFGNYGNYVDIRSTTPTGETRYARYAHLSSVAVTPTQIGVYRGQKIGVEGDTGKTYQSNGQACGPHLHFRWTSTQECSSTSCAFIPEPMSGLTGFAAGQTKTSNNFPFKADFNSDGCPDIVAREPAGDLFRYEIKCNGDAGTRILVSGGWQVYDRLLTAGDLNADGCGDILGREPAGFLWWYPGNCAGGIGTRQAVGGGWQIYDIILGPGDFNGDGCADLLARDTTGFLYVYHGNCAGAFATRVLVSGGWQVYNSIIGPGDFDGDGCADLLARQPAGWLYRYHVGCSGTPGTGILVSGGWQVYDILEGPADFTAHGCADLIDRLPAGPLYRYEGTCTGGVSSAILISGGWQVYDRIIAP
jgi:hypothetical protein